MQEKKKFKKKNVFYYLAPKHLMGEVTGWGFHFSWGEILKSYGIYSAIGLLCGFMFGLDWKFMILMLLIETIFIPSLIANNYERMYNQKKFDDVNDYIEQILYSFSQSKKIITALEDTKTIFPEGSPMEITIQNAYSKIMNGKNNNPNVTEEALESIELLYPVERLHTVHQFLLKVEKKGGNFDKTLSLLLEDRASWEERNAKAANLRNQKKRMTTISLIIAMIVCAVFTRILVYVIDTTISVSDILQSLPSQIATLITWFLMLLIYLSSDRHSVNSWLDDTNNASDKLKLKRYYDVINYDASKEFKKSILYALVPGIMTVICLVLGKTIPGIIFAGVTVIFLNQHTIGYKLKKKATIEEIELTYPRWLMELALLLQTGNVQVSMYKSYENAPIVLKPALEKFFSELEANPTSKEPYNNFLKEFDIKGVNSTMKMLYALYNGSGTDKDTQIANILRRNNEMLDLSEKVRLENSLAIYSLLFLLPELCMAIKLVTDMFVFMMTLMNSLTIS